MLRAITFADLARRPTIVGGHMFSMYDRSVLHSFGETIARYNWWWGAAPRTVHEHDFGRRNLRNTQWLHRRVDVDYNGWWMCLIPTSVVRTSACRCRCSSSGTTPSTAFARRRRACRSCRCRVSPCGTSPGRTRTMRSTGRRTSTCATGSSPHCCTRRTHAAAAWLRKTWSTRSGTCSRCSTRPRELRLLAIEDVLAGPEHMHADILDEDGSAA